MQDLRNFWSNFGFSPSFSLVSKYSEADCPVWVGRRMVPALYWKTNRFLEFRFWSLYLISCVTFDQAKNADSSCVKYFEISNSYFTCPKTCIANFNNFGAKFGNFFELLAPFFLIKLFSNFKFGTFFVRTNGRGGLHLFSNVLKAPVEVLKLDLAGGRNKAKQAEKSSVLTPALEKLFPPTIFLATFNEVWYFFERKCDFLKHFLKGYLAVFGNFFLVHSWHHCKSRISNTTWHLQVSPTSSNIVEMNFVISPVDSQQPSCNKKC